MSPASSALASGFFTTSTTWEALFQALQEPKISLPWGQKTKTTDIVTHSINTLKMDYVGTSLVVQWLRIWLPMQETWV